LLLPYGINSSTTFEQQPLTPNKPPPHTHTHRSEQERFRRRDLLHVLRNRREQIQQSLKRQPQASGRNALLSGGAGGSGAARETETTAQLDSRGLLQLQEQVMRQQDTELEHMEKTVTSTKVGRGAAAGPGVVQFWCCRKGGHCPLLSLTHTQTHPWHITPPPSPLFQSIDSTSP